MISENYNDITVTPKTKSGMGLTIDDQKWIKLLFDRQDWVTQEYIGDTYEKHAKLITDVVREMLNDYKKEMFIALERIELSIEGVKKDIKEIKAETLDLKNSIKDHEFRILRIEKHLSL